MRETDRKRAQRRGTERDRQKKRKSQGQRQTARDRTTEGQGTEKKKKKERERHRKRQRTEATDLGRDRQNIAWLIVYISLYYCLLGKTVSSY